MLGLIAQNSFVQNQALSKACLPGGLIAPNPFHDGVSCNICVDISLRIQLKIVFLVKDTWSELICEYESAVCDCTFTLCTDYTINELVFFS